MRFKDFGLTEASVPRNQFDAILRDPSIHMGFECEMIFDRESSDEVVDPDSYNWVDLRDYLYINSRQRRDINDDYHEWLADQVSEEWSRVRDEVTRQYCDDNDLWKRDEDGDIEDEEDTIEANEADARDEWEEQEADDIRDGKDMDDFISDRYGSNTVMMASFDIEPLYGWGEDLSEIRTQEGSSTADVYHEMARDIERAVGANVEVSAEYHSSHKDENTWYIEPDGSLKADGGTPGEVVSEVYALTDGLDAMQSLFDWMESEGHKTNNSTGLHINLSIEGKNEADFDFLKMILFHDERHVASLFDRLDNTYAEQMRNVLFDKVQKALNNHGHRGLDPHEVMDGRDLATLLAQLKKIGLKLVPMFDKYWSIRNRNNGVFEFRSMGNKNYHQRFDDIRKRVVNMAYLLKIGSDDSLLATEYVSKVYGLLANRKYDDSRQRSPLPPQLSTLAHVLDGHPDIISQASTNPIQFLASVAQLIISTKAPLNPAQRRQIKAMIIRQRLKPEMLLGEMSEELYNTIALMVGWPVAVPDEDERQATLPAMALKGRPPASGTAGRGGNETAMRGAQETAAEAARRRQETVYSTSQAEMFGADQAGYREYLRRLRGY